MSGALGFIRANPVMQGWDQQEERTARRRQRDDARATDQAIREGVGEYLSQGAPSATQGPASGLGAVQAPAAAPTPTPAPAESGGAWQPDDRYFSTVMAQESGGDPNARNPRSSATGPYQFIDSTWRSYIAAQPEVFAGMTPEQAMAARTDPRFARLGAEWFTRQNLDELRRQGLPADAAGAGLSHVFGAAGAATLLRADPNAPVESILPAQVIAANPNLRGQTVGQLRQTFATRYGGGGGGAPAMPTPIAPPPAAMPQQRPGNPYGPVLSRLVATPGAGAAALNLLQRGESEATRRAYYASKGAGGMTASAMNQAERNIIYALGRGEVDVAKAIAARVGMQLPPAVLENARGRELFARGANLASRHYRNDPAQGQRFLQAFIQSGGNLDAAAQAAGAPAGAPPNWRIEMLRQDDRDFLAFVNPRTGEIRLPGGQQVAPGFAGGGAPAAAPPAAPAAPAAPEQPPTEGQPPQQQPFVSSGRPGSLSRSPRAGSQARTPDREVRRQMAIAGGATEQEAAAIASGMAVTAAQRARAFERFRTAAEKEVLETNPARREAEVQRRTNAAMAEWDRVVGATSGGSRPQTPAPAAGASPPPTMRGPDGSEGTFVETDRAGRHIYRTPSGRRFAVTPGGA